MKKKKIFTPLSVIAALLFIGIIAPAAYYSTLSDPFGQIDPQPAPTRAVIEAGNGLSEAPVTVSQEESCTYPLEYWLQNSDRWPRQVVLGRQHYSSADIMALWGSETPDLPTEVVLAAYTALLNIINGASPVWIEATLEELDGWLSQHPPGSDLSEFNSQQGRHYARLLTEFSEGLHWPEACPFERTAVVAELEAAPEAPPTAAPLAPTLYEEIRIASPLASPTNPPPPTEAPAPTSTPMPTPTDAPPPTNAPPPAPARGLDPTQPPPPPTAEPTPVPEKAQVVVEKNKDKDEDKDEDKGKGKDDDKDKGKDKDEDKGKDKSKDDDKSKDKDKSKDDDKDKGKDKDRDKDKDKDKDKGKGGG